MASNPKIALKADAIQSLVDKTTAALVSADRYTPLVEDARFASDDLTLEQTAAIIDHTLLKPDATSQQIEQLCSEAIALNFASVCVNLTWLADCNQILGDSSVKRCSVVGFPSGATSTRTKAFEAEEVLAAGGDEIDMVLNIGRLKSGHIRQVFEDIREVVEVAHAGDALVKVILETFLLSEEEKVVASTIVREAGADFVKTATGFNGGGATAEDVALMRTVVGETLGVKASGGVRTAERVRTLVAAGATRIGSSAGVDIMRGFNAYTTSSAEGEEY